MGNNNNNPKKGSHIAADPITNKADIERGKQYLSDNPRNYAIFVLGINTNLRISDIRTLKIGQVRGISTGQDIVLFEKKTGKQRRITINNAVYLALAPLLTSLKDSPPTDPLFQSEKTGSCLTVPTLSTLVKTWCRRAKIQKGKFSGHSMRKAFGYFQRQVFGTPTYILSEMFNHSSEKITLKYLGIQPEEIKTAYMREI